MRNRITVSHVAAMMAESTGKPVRLCEDFIRELFVLVSDSLAEGESVRIKGFGTFRLSPVEARKSVDVTTGQEMRIEPYNRITFAASKELASLVNSPFEAFGTIEIEDGVQLGIEHEEETVDADVSDALDVSDESGFAVASECADMSEVSVASVDSVDDEDIEPSEDSAQTEMQESSEVPDENAESVIAAQDESTDEQDMTDADNPDDVTDADDLGEDREEDEEAAEAVIDSVERDLDPEMHRPSRKFGWGFFAGFMSALMIGALAVYFVVISGILDRNEDGNKEKVADRAAVVEEPAAPVIEENGLPTDTVAEVSIGESVEETGMDKLADTAPSDSPAPVYDVITTTRYLTTVAQEHYGNFNFWPYIYEENKALLGHPNRIKPGTKIVVPQLSKYGVDPKKKSDIDKAKRKGVEIYSRYGGK